jgi:hypothetical protein
MPGPEARDGRQADQAAAQKLAPASAFFLLRHDDSRNFYRRIVVLMPRSLAAKPNTEDTIALFQHRVFI